MKIFLKIVFVVVLTYCQTNNLSCQNFNYLKSINCKIGNGLISVVSITSDSKKNNYTLINYSRINSNSVDTITIDSFKIVVPVGSFAYSFIIKADLSGIIKSYSLLGNIRGANIVIDENDSIFIAFSFINVSTIQIGNSNYSGLNGNVGLLKLDSTLNFVWIKQYGNKDSNLPKIKLNNSKLLFLFNCSYLTNIGNKTYNIGLNSNIFGEINKYTGDVIWSNIIFNNVYYPNNLLKINDLVCNKSEIFLTGYLADYNNSRTYVIIANDTVWNGSFIIKCDSIGNYLSNFKICSGNINNSKFTESNFIEVNGNSLFFGGSYTDSLIWNGKVIRSDYNSGPGLLDFFIASVDLSFKPIWFYHPKIINKNYQSGSSTCAFYSNEFLYVGVALKTEILIENILVSPGFIGPNNTPDALFLKFDKIGNILWFANGGSKKAHLNSICYQSGNAIYASGSYRDSIRFGQLNLKSNSSSELGWILQLSDNAIIRGAVGKGPYCAGDSIKVPFKKIGDFDTSNYFIAELSDEQGNFTGQHHELGRVKSNQDSIVTGLLPSLSIASSNKYRIRIISTAPAVQSYYKVDTLRLLIYSKDKAWAGNDTVICKGDSIQLETFGGTKWHWSPGYKLQDSTARTTFAWPDKTTIYRITIADSSGCGAPDTAFKTIHVRPELKVNISTPKDTGVCIGGTMPVVAGFSGGDSTNYSWQWYSINSLGAYTLERTGQLQQADTLQFTMPVNEPDSMRLVLYLSDGCTPKTAFANYTLKVKKQAAQTVFNYYDTSLCPGKSNALIADFTGSPKDKLSWSWQESTTIANQWVQRRTGSNKQSDTWNYTLPLTWKGTKKIRVLLNDACSGLKDTALLNITPKDTLQLQLNTKDTTLCYGQWFTYQATGKGGNKEGYKFVWTDLATGDTLSIIDSLQVIANTNQTIRLHLSDGCMPKTTTAQFTITVRAPLEVAIDNTNDTVLCEGQGIMCIASAVGGNGNYSYHWLLDGQDQSTNDSITLINNGTDIGLKQLQLIVSDGCTSPEDTAYLNIDFKSVLSQAITSIDSLCFGASATLKTKASGGIDNYIYQWLDNNTTLSNTDSLKITNTQSGKVRYISIVNDGCSLPDTISIDIINLDPLKIELSTTDSCPTGTAIIQSKVNGGKASQLKVSWFNNNIQIHQGDSLSVNPASYTSRLFTAIASDGCSSENDTANIQIGSAPKIKILALGECLCDTTRFLAKQMNSTGATIYAWTLNSATLPFTDSTAFHSFTSTGSYKIKVEVNSNGTCKGSDSLSGFILNKPKAAFTLAHFDRNAQGIPFKFIDQSSGANSWLWNFGNGDTSQRQHPDYTYNDTGKARVVLIVSNNGKCFDSTSLLIPVMDKIEFFMPNVFSPNGNSINETFGLSANQWNKVKEFNLKIYNRWGEKVFDSDHMEEHWTGEGAQQSVYIYKLTIRDVYNVLHEMEGVVELLE